MNKFNFITNYFGNHSHVIDTSSTIGLKKIKSLLSLTSFNFITPLLPPLSLKNRGKVISICLKVENINPEQSKPALVVPPPLYLVPMCCDAFAIKNSALDIFSGESSSTSFWTTYNLILMFLLISTSPFFNYYFISDW